MKTLTSLKERVKQERKQIVAVADATDKEILQAVKMAIDEKLCSFFLYGDEAAITSLAKEVNLDLSLPQVTLHHVKQDAAKVAVQAVHDQEADILMKGNIPTRDLLKAVLHNDYGLRTGKVLSHVSLFEIPNREGLVFLTDAAMNIAPTLQEKAEIIQNAVQVAHGVGLAEPKVAALAPVEVINPSMSSTMDAAVLTQMQKRGQIKGCLIDGPLAFDNAVSSRAAKHKNIQSDVAGDADILMVPTIEAGNALYKSFIYFAGAEVAAIISGAKAPIILTSRADSAESKLSSLSLALVSSKTF